ncbi:MAG TPA: twin-arginine translocation signal domain-containing protein [Chthoniobacterales bacterium]|nr:twin-arginine translocation signal domain-containing protein [Chthoniobacterales bacterium]
MNTTRRRFLQVSAMTGGAMSLGLPTLRAADKAAKPLRILILGGTGFTGPNQVQYAVDRGH